MFVGRRALTAQRFYSGAPGVVAQLRIVAVGRRSFVPFSSILFRLLSGWVVLGTGDCSTLLSAAVLQSTRLFHWLVNSCPTWRSICLLSIPGTADQVSEYGHRRSPLDAYLVVAPGYRVASPPLVDDLPNVLDRGNLRPSAVGDNRGRPVVSTLLDLDQLRPIQGANSTRACLLSGILDHGSTSNTL